MDRYLVDNIEKIFYEFNQYFIDQEQIDTTKLYIDGTKIESAANKYTFIWRGSITKFKAKLNLKVSKQLQILNQRYQASDIYFSLHEDYDINYLKQIKRFLEAAL